MSPERGENITPEAAREISPELQRQANQARDAFLNNDYASFLSFRREHPEIPIDFSRKKIRSFFHSGIYPEQLDLSKCIFRNADFTRGHLRGNKFDGGINLQGADLSNAKFTILPGEYYNSTSKASNEMSPDVNNCNFDGANLNNAILRRTRFEKCSFQNASFDGADLRGASFDSECTGIGEDELMWAKFYYGGYNSLQIHSESDNGISLMNDIIEARQLKLQEIIMHDLDEEDKKQISRYFDIATTAAREIHLTAEEKNLNGIKWSVIADRDHLCIANLRLINCDLQKSVFKGNFGPDTDFTGSNLSNANFKDAVIYSRQIKTAANTEGVIWPDKPREEIDEDLLDKKILEETYAYYEKLGVKLPSAERKYKYSGQTFFRRNIDIYQEQEEKLDEQDRINWPVVYSIETKNTREKLSKKEMAEVFIVFIALKKSLKLNKDQIKRATDILAIKQREKTVFWTTEDAVADAVQDVAEGAILGREEYRQLASSTRRSSE